MNARSIAPALPLIVVLFTPVAALAVDGVDLINQSRANAGNVTPGDTAGFPVTISRSGSYRLSGNLTVPNENTTAIDITANDVSIDLNGFAIIGRVECTKNPDVVCNPTVATGDGVRALSRENITVRNGTVRGMGSYGIRLEGRGHLVEDVRLSDNRFVGATVSGGIITHCVARVNGNDGFRIFLGTISDSVAFDNGGAGIRATSALASHNFSSSNDGAGLDFSNRSGYAGNVISFNNPDVSGSGVNPGENLGQNLCTGVLCP